jgi:hypothetical protein
LDFPGFSEIRGRFVPSSRISGQSHFFHQLNRWRHTIFAGKHDASIVSITRSQGSWRALKVHPSTLFLPSFLSPSSTFPTTSL